MDWLTALLAFLVGLGLFGIIIAVVLGVIILIALAMITSTIKELASKKKPVKQEDKIY